MKAKCPVQHKIQYYNRRHAERGMLAIYKRDHIKIYGSYQCPHCALWHITSQYDNRSRQSKHEFRQHNQKLRRASKKRKYESLSQAEIKQALKQLNPPKVSRFWWVKKLWKSIRSKL